jgi:hypothetical protein
LDVPTWSEVLAREASHHFKPAQMVDSAPAQSMSVQRWVAMSRFEQRRARAGDAGAGSQFPARIDAAATQNPAFVAVASKFTSAAGDGRAAEDGPGARLHQQHLLRRGRPEGGLIEESPIVAFLIALRADGWAEGCYDLFWLWSL